MKALLNNTEGREQAAAIYLGVLRFHLHGIRLWVGMARVARRDGESGVAQAQLARARHEAAEFRNALKQWRAETARRQSLAAFLSR